MNQCPSLDLCLFLFFVFLMFKVGVCMHDSMCVCGGSDVAITLY